MAIYKTHAHKPPKSVMVQWSRKYEPMCCDPKGVEVNLGQGRAGHWGWGAKYRNVSSKLIREHSDYSGLPSSNL